MAQISVGSKLPEGKLAYLDSTNTKQVVDIVDEVKGKRVVIFGVPGAFTSTCSQKHVPDFVKRYDDLKAKGIDAIYCISVNDVFVMQAWENTFEKLNGKVKLLADGNGDYTKALGLELDLTAHGLGIRSKRFALLADDGVVKILNLEEGGAYTISGPEGILKGIEAGAV